MKQCYMDKNCKKHDNGECPFPEFCIKKFKLDRFYDLACMTDKMRFPVYVPVDDEDISAFNELENIRRRITDFVEEGENLYIYSAITGNGKTAWAVRFLQSYINEIWYKHDISTVALFVNVPRYLLSVKDSFSSKNDYADHIKETIMDCPLVVWDDIATKDMSEFEREQLLSIMDYRFNEGLSNVLTSNADPSSLFKIIGKRLSSRIVGNTTKIQFTGKDKRK